jgi:hypothetical protein
MQNEQLAMQNEQWSRESVAANFFTVNFAIYNDSLSWEAL